jgi:hypothetical protein
VKSDSSGKNAALNLMGIVPDSHIKTTDFAQGLYYRKNNPLLAFCPSYNPQLPGCVVGVDLLVERDQWGKYLQWTYLPRWSYGITCFPLTPKGTLVKTGTSISANTGTFYYSDNLNSGLARVDSTYVYLPFEKLQSLSGIVGGKNRDIGILKSVGVSQFGIMRVFMRYAVLTGIVGAAVGIAAALIFLDNINDLEDWLFAKFGFQMWNREIYAIGDIPSQPGFALPIEVAAAAVIACLLGALLPTIKAARQNCVDTLRVNQI